MPARLNVHYRDRSDLPMSDRDIWLDYKNAKNPRMQVRILAELNETKKQTIEEIINEQRAIEERKLILLKEVEQVKQTEEERKAKKAAYMKEYWARKKAEKTEPQPTQVRPVTEPITTEQEPAVTVYHVDTGVVEEKELAAALIDKAVRHYYEDLAEAVLDQRAVVDQVLAKYEAAVKKYQEMQADLLRCKRYLGIPEEELQTEDEEVAENVCD